MNSNSVEKFIVIVSTSHMLPMLHFFKKDLSSLHHCIMMAQDIRANTYHSSLFFRSLCYGTRY